jgi:hypothetical protein
MVSGGRVGAGCPRHGQGSKPASLRQELSFVFLKIYFAYTKRFFFTSQSVYARGHVLNLRSGRPRRGHGVLKLRTFIYIFEHIIHLKSIVMCLHLYSIVEKYSIEEKYSIARKYTKKTHTSCKVWAGTILI